MRTRLSRAGRWWWCFHMACVQQMQLQAEERAALVMQRYWRRGLAYLELRRLKRQQAERRELMGVKAFVVQRLWRGHKARRRVRRLRDDRARWKEMGAQLELQSALRIQVSKQKGRETDRGPARQGVEGWADRQGRTGRGDGKSVGLSPDVANRAGRLTSESGCGVGVVADVLPPVPRTDAAAQDATRAQDAVEGAAG